MSTEAFFRVIDRKTRSHQLPVEYEKRAVEERVADFDEVICGFDIESAKAEASRCIQCPEPQACMLNCPAGNDIPEALWAISQGDFIGAAKVFAATSPLPEICGRVCPNLCQRGCVLGRVHGSASVGKLEAFVADIARRAGALAIDAPEQKTGHRVAIVGSGAAGLTVAEDLIKRGHQVTVYEAWPVAGGTLIYGIPSFKLSKDIVLNKIQDLENAGVNFITNTRIGESITIDDLQRQYDAVFMATGAGVQTKMNIPGEDLPGIYASTDFLIRTNVPTEMLPPHQQVRPTIGRRVAVIGGGDSAIDCARSAVRLGADEVTIIYRRTEAEMPGNKTERAVCFEEGVQIQYLQLPTEFIGDKNGQLKAIKLARMALGDRDASGRRRPLVIEQSEFIREIDTVILAIGYKPDPLLDDKTKNPPAPKWALTSSHQEMGATPRKNVFVADDDIDGPNVVITAIARAHTAAKNIDAYLQEESTPE